MLSSPGPSVSGHGPVVFHRPCEEERAIISYQRDRFVDTEDLTLPFLDDISGTIRGYRIFTACRTANGKIFRLEDHLDRLYASAAGLYMKPPMAPDDLRALLDRIVAENRNHQPRSDFHIEIIFSGGLEGNTMKQSGKPAHLYVAVQELVPPSPDMYENGVALATFPHQRLLPDVKLLNYVGAVLAHQTVVPRYNCWDVVFVEPPDGKVILEGSTFTVFFVESPGVIVTPPLDGKILDSITRRVIVELIGARNDLVLREETFTIDGLDTASESFLASTTRGVLPVVRIDDRIIGSGRPGETTKAVMTLFRDYLSRY